MPGSGSPFTGINPKLIAAKDLLFFVTDGDAPELWSSDGSEAGTRRAARFGAGSSLDGLTAVGANLFFVADGRELWKSDGSEDGTERLGTFAVGIGTLVDAHGTLVFSADDGFWQSDGTTSGTTRIGDGPYFYGPLVRFGRRAFFSASDALAGAELWALPLTFLHCGNAMPDPGEDCDTGGASPTCDVDCTLPECGDGTVNPAADEECDFGDALDGGCCTTDCTRRPTGATCSSATVCGGADTCDAAGRCQPRLTLDCDDGNVSTFDVCDRVQGCLHRAMPVCGGDCDFDDTVSIDELVTLVRIALGAAPLSSCAAGNPNGDGEITIAELITAVGYALSGCTAE